MTIEEGLNQVERGYQKFVESNSLMTDAVMNAFLFTWQWWLGIGLFFVPWILWFLFRKKESSGRLLIGAFSAVILGLIIDLIALSVGRWSYPMKVSPISPMLFLPYHFSLLPVSIMFVLQYKPRTNPLIKGVIYSAFSAFLFMRLFVMIGFYNPKGWPSIYDFFIYLSVFMVAYWFSSMNNFEKIRSNDKADHQTSFTFLRRKEKAR